MRRLPLALLGLVLTACGTAQAPGSGPFVLATPTTEGETGCDSEPLPARRGQLTALDPDGAVLWQRDLPPGDAQSAPVSDGARVVVGDWQGLAAFDARTGEPRWQVAATVPAYGLWRSGELVVGLGAQVGDDGEVVGVDAATGAVRWRHDLPDGGLLGDQVLTGDGGLAWSLDHDDRRTQVLDLATGEVRWTSEARGTGAHPVAAGGLVLRAEADGVTAYDAQTGQVRWRGGPGGEEARLQVLGDVVVVDQAVVGPDYDGAVRALRLSDGSAGWTLDEAEPLGVAGLGPAGVVTYRTEGAGPLALVDPATGRERWRTRGGVLPELPVLVTEDAVVTVEGGFPAQPQGAVVARAAAGGTTRWTVPRDEAQGPAVRPAPDRLLVVRSAGDGSRVDVLDLRTGATTGRAEVLGYPDRPGDLPFVQSSDPHYGCIG